MRIFGYLLFPLALWGQTLPNLDQYLQRESLAEMERLYGHPANRVDDVWVFPATRDGFKIIAETRPGTLFVNRLRAELVNPKAKEMLVASYGKYKEKAFVPLRCKSSPDVLMLVDTDPKLAGERYWSFERGVSAFIDKEPMVLEFHREMRVLAENPCPRPYRLAPLLGTAALPELERRFGKPVSQEAAGKSWLLTYPPSAEGVGAIAKVRQAGNVVEEVVVAYGSPGGLGKILIEYGTPIVKKVTTADCVARTFWIYPKFEMAVDTALAAVIFGRPYEPKPGVCKAENGK